MGLFNWFKSKNKDEYAAQENISGNRIAKKTKETIKQKRIITKEELWQYIREYCEQIAEATQAIEDTKSEYQLVTAYISDIQRIEMLSLAERDKLNDAARKIVNLNEERISFQQSGSRISDTQFRNIERQEEEILPAIKKIKELEEYNYLIKTDMAHLEGEKSALKHEMKESNIRQSYLKRITIVTGILSTILVLMFTVMANVFEVDMKVPYMLTIFMLAVMLTYIFVESRRNIYEIKLAEIKINKTISILNKVKIKCVNNTSNLEYNYSKYMIGSAHELSYLWEEYIKAKDKESRYKQTTELLEYYNEILIEFLRNLKLSDANIWIHQALAIIDDNEMSQIKQRLEFRRNKLKGKIDYNQDVKNINFKKIRLIIEKKPGAKEETVKIAAQYGIML